jgi:hypothetical protein
MQLKGNLSTQLIDQEAGTGPLIRSDLKDSLRLDLGYEVLPDRPYISKPVIGEFEVGVHIESISAAAAVP